MVFTYKSNYFEFDQDDPLAPLLYCIYEMIVGGNDLELYLRGTIGKEIMEPVGGDPGWNLVPEIQEDGRYLYMAWVWEGMGVEPNEGKYEEDVVKFHIRKGLKNVLKEQPDRRQEIESIFSKYDL